MSFIKSQYIYFFILAVFVSGIWVSMPGAKIAIVTQIATGQVISISDKNIIELDDGYSYSPGKKGISLSIIPGEYISIRYYINGNNEKVYIEYAPGKNSLKATPVPDRASKPKRKL